MMNFFVFALRSTVLRSAIAVFAMAGLVVPNISGCAIFDQVVQAIPTVEPSQYKNLSGQSVAVVVWAEENGLRIDWPRIHLDVAQMIQSKLQKSQATDKPKELDKTRFPVSPGSVARFQEENPAFAAEDMNEVAAKLGVSRVIYVELRNFQTRSEASNDLFRGNVSGSVKVIEVGNGVGRTTFNIDTLKVSYPRSSPEEGLPNIGDFPIYHGTLDGFTDEVVKLFVPHANDRDAEYALESSVPTH